ncbi:helix-turn-helix domain-containing protein [Xanthobacter wiegelii]|uniref:helix-turn-helix domain-containing protein n=1 Tax=Xanthobacter wiegelii TaxID=3119913 RepID=UPI0037277EA9
MEDLQRTLASNLRRYRLQAGLSQEEIAERMSVDRAYVSGLERGRRNPTLSTLVSAAQALGVPVATLLTEETTSEVASKRVRAPRRKPAG